MFSPASDIAKAASGVKAVLGDPPRFFSFGEAPEGVARPYAVWQLLPGSTPENYLADRPDADLHIVQVDAYGREASDARSTAAALVTAFETEGNVTSWNGESKDPDTSLFRISFTVEFVTPRT